jgi:hypothetical protein
MTEEARRSANYLTGSACFENGFVEELVIYCIDPLTPEAEEEGYLHENFVATASGIIEDIKKGDNFFARFAGSTKLFPVEIVVRHGKETLEVQDVGQAAEFKSLHNLPVFTSPEKQAWVQAFYDHYQALTKDKLGYMVPSYVSWGAYADHGHGDPGAAARLVFESHSSSV